MNIGAFEILLAIGAAVAAVAVCAVCVVGIVVWLAGREPRMHK